MNNEVKIGLVTYIAKDLYELRDLLNRKLHSQTCEDDFSEYKDTVNRVVAVNEAINNL